MWLTRWQRRPMGHSYSRASSLRSAIDALILTDVSTDLARNIGEQATQGFRHRGWWRKMLGRWFAAEDNVTPRNACNAAVA